MSRKQRQFVKILATSDLHGFCDGLQEACETFCPAVLVIAGDLHPAVIGTDPDDWFRKTFFPIVSKLRCEVVAIPGNHDFWLASHSQHIFGTSSKNDIAKIAPKNFHLLLDSEITLYGLRFYGTPWVPWISGHWCFESHDEDLKPWFSNIPSGIDVLISHSPPKFAGSNLDVSLERPVQYQCHYGSVSLAEAIERAKPQYCFCGHIHSGDHAEFKAPCGTRIFNVSRVNEHYQIYYAPQKLEISKSPIDR